MTPRAQFETALAALSEEQRREVRLLARPFEWTALEVVGSGVYGRCRGIDCNIVTLRDGDRAAYCSRCQMGACVHGLALQMLYFGGHPMKTIRDRKVHDR